MFCHVSRSLWDCWCLYLYPLFTLHDSVISLTWYALQSICVQRFAHHTNHLMIIATKPQAGMCKPMNNHYQPKYKANLFHQHSSGTSSSCKCVRSILHLGDGTIDFHGTLSFFKSLLCYLCMKISWPYNALLAIRWATTVCVVIRTSPKLLFSQNFIPLAQQKMTGRTTRWRERLKLFGWMMNRLSVGEGKLFSKIVSDARWRRRRKAPLQFVYGL